MEFWGLLQSILILLTGAMLFGLLFERIGLNAMLGYLFAGTIVGPGALGFVHDADLIGTIAELGVALLLFSIGLEFSVRRLLDLGRVALLGGVLQITVTVVLVAAVAMSFGLGVPASIALGAIVAPSSTACVLRLLRERGELDSLRGRNALGILLLQDAALVPLVLLVTSLKGPAAPLAILLNISKAMALTAVFVGVLYLLSRFVLPRLFRSLSEVKSRELFVVLAVVVCVGASYAAHGLHLSPSLGAFVAGVLLAESPFAMQIRADVGGIRILFVTLFFTSVGMLADLTWLYDNILLAAAATVALLIGKAAVIVVVLVMLRVPRGAAIATGMLLAQAGEFSFVLATLAVQGSGALLTSDLFQLVATATLASLFATPFLIALAPRVQKWADARWQASMKQSSNAPEAQESLPIEFFNHVVVIGYGPAGRRVVEALRAEGELVIVVELNHDTVVAAREQGLIAEMGDATQADVLEHLAIEQALALVVTIPDHRAAVEIIRQARSLAPHLAIHARARLARFIPEMCAAGADVALDEEDQIGIALGARLRESLNMRLSGVSPRASAREVDEDPVGPARETA